MSAASFHITNWKKFKHIRQKNNNTYFLLLSLKIESSSPSSLMVLIHLTVFPGFSWQLLTCVCLCVIREMPLGTGLTGSSPYIFSLVIFGGSSILHLPFSYQIETFIRDSLILNLGNTFLWTLSWGKEDQK